MTVTMYSNLALWKAAAAGWTEDTAYGTDLANITSVTLGDGTALVFSYTGFPHTMQIKTVPAGWSTWSGGYTAQVIQAKGRSHVDFAISAVGAFGLYAEGSTLGATLSMTMLCSDGATLTQSVAGTGGAAFFGWVGAGITSFTMTTLDVNFAIGDLFSAPVTVDSDVSCCEDPVIVDAEVVALLAQRQLRVAHLVAFDFLTTPKYLWNGFRDLVTGGSGSGHTWQGLRNLGGIEGLEETSDLTSSQMKFTLSGVNAAILALAIFEDRDEYVGRLVTVWLQFFNSEWQNIGDPIARACGIMDGLEISRAREGDGSSVRTLTLTAENIFYGRGVPPAGNYTDADQQLRFPGDRGLQFVNEVQNTVIQVPW